MQKIQLAHRERNPDYYDRERDMFTALAWSSVKKTLIEAEREELFAYITSVRLTDASIVITTSKPIANAELKLYREKLLENINRSLSMMKGVNREKIRFL
jgi:hypothetical protein